MTYTDTFLLNRAITLSQLSASPAPALDPVLLAAHVPTTNTASLRVLDLGCGVGTALLCYALRNPSAQLTGIDKQAELCELAINNANRNFPKSDITIIQCNVSDMFANAAIKPDSFDIVMTNPPYYTHHHATQNKSANKTMANVESIPLDDWIKQSIRALSARGILVLILRAERLDHVIQSLKGLAGKIAITPIWPKAGRAAKLFLLQATRNSRSVCTLGSGITLHNDDGSYTTQAIDILYNAKQLTP